MKKTLQTLLYLSKSIFGLTAIGFLSILGVLTLTNLIFNLTDRYDNVLTVRQTVTLDVPIDITAGIFALLTGLLPGIANFKVALANGVSRKTFILANLPAAALSAAAFSTFNLILMQLCSLFWPISLTIQLLYPVTSLANLLVLQFSIYFLLIMTGRSITFAYYRCSAQGKWVLSLAPFALFGLLKGADAYLGGAIFAAINDYLHWSLYFSRFIPAMLAYSAIFYALVYLLVRRAPLKD